MLDPHSGRCFVAMGIRKGDHIPHEMIPLGIGRGKPPAYLRLLHVLRWDDEHQFLADERSYIGVYCRPEMTDDACLVRSDFNRDLRVNPDEHPYPTAHMHVYGKNAAHDELCASTPSMAPGLHELHFPTGGRRFRPSLEDAVEFTIVERIVTAPRDEWRDAVAEHRGEVGGASAPRGGASESRGGGAAAHRGRLGREAATGPARDQHV